MALVASRAPDAGPLEGDGARLQQVVWNLLSNAVKFAPPGGHVEVVARRVEDEIEVRISDDGCGIPASFLPHVFERFRQAETATTRAHGGLGLGLAIVRHLVEAHGGTVRAESEGERRGATFTVRLPCAGVAPMPGNVRRAPPVVRGLVSLEALHALLVEDEPDARSLITTVLESRGMRVTAVGTAAEALDAIRRERPDILLSDIGLPHEDGYTLIRRVRAIFEDEGGSEIPAAALTAYASAEDRRRAIEAGYRTHVAKPLDPAFLLAVVARLTGRLTGL